jgi:hypothetical protein
MELILAVAVGVSTRLLAAGTLAPLGSNVASIGVLHIGGARL